MGATGLTFRTSPERDWYFPGAEDAVREGDQLAVILMEDANPWSTLGYFPQGMALVLEILEVRWPWFLRVRTLSPHGLGLRNWSAGVGPESCQSDLFWQDQGWNLLIYDRPVTVLVAKICASETGSQG